MKKLLITTGTAILVLGVVPRIPAVDATPNRHYARNNSVSSLEKELHLSPLQHRQISTIHHRYQARISQDAQTVQVGVASMLALFQSPKASATDLQQERQKLQQAIDRLGTDHFDEMLAIRDLLTPAQRKLAANRVASWLAMPMRMMAD